MSQTGAQSGNVSEWLTAKEIAATLDVSRGLVYGLFKEYDRDSTKGLRYKRVSKRHILVHRDWFGAYMHGREAVATV